YARHKITLHCPACRIDPDMIRIARLSIRTIDRKDAVEELCKKEGQWRQHRQYISDQLGLWNGEKDQNKQEPDPHQTTNAGVAFLQPVVTCKDDGQSCSAPGQHHRQKHGHIKPDRHDVIEATLRKTLELLVHQIILEKPR